MFNPSLLGKAMLAQACLMEMKGATTQLDEVTARHGLDREFDGTTSECMSYYIEQLFSSYTKAYDYYNDMKVLLDLEFNAIELEKGIVLPSSANIIVPTREQNKKEIKLGK